MKWSTSILHTIEIFSKSFMHFFKRQLCKWRKNVVGYYGMRSRWGYSCACAYAIESIAIILLRVRWMYNIKCLLKKFTYGSNTIYKTVIDNYENENWRNTYKNRDVQSLEIHFSIFYLIYIFCLFLITIKLCEYCILTPIWNILGTSWSVICGQKIHSHIFISDDVIHRRKFLTS